jgi:1,4-alpha-glucan branching enzyme
MAGTAVCEAVRGVAFRLDGRRIPGARSVVLAGSFNRWDGSMHRLALGGDGWWTATLPLPPGVYSYLFVVDGFPWNDPEDDLRVESEWGGQYSVRIVQ